MDNVKCFLSEKKEKRNSRRLVGCSFFLLAAVDTKLALSFIWPNWKWIRSRGTLYENLVKTL